MEHIDEIITSISGEILNDFLLTNFRMNTQKKVYWKTHGDVPGNSHDYFWKKFKKKKSFRISPEMLGKVSRKVHGVVSRMFPRISKLIPKKSQKKINAWFPELLQKFQEDF